MGVLDDSDIEKISQVIKKKNIPKFFNDPIKGYRAYDIACTIAIAASILAGFLYVSSTIITNHLEDENQSLQNYQDVLINRVNLHSNLITSNADCSSLFLMYNSAKDNPELAYTKKLIKDEIAFRCK